MGDSDGVADKCQEVSVLKNPFSDRCYHQIAPKPRRNFNFPGCGDCNTCAYDPENNKKCSGYTINSTY